MHSHAERGEDPNSETSTNPVGADLSAKADFQAQEMHRLYRLFADKSAPTGLRQIWIPIASSGLRLDFYTSSFPRSAW
jgi:hypothetical protein